MRSRGGIVAGGGGCVNRAAGPGAVTAPLSGNADISAAPPLLFSLRCVILFGRKPLLHKMRGENEHIAVTGGGEGGVGVVRRCGEISGTVLVKCAWLLRTQPFGSERRKKKKNSCEASKF